ncbi:uncharacterized protein LOC129607046 [Condylostylus longicornis]|uniref:uncharacterized protein LOC129607046 n=1 Tax=Condylostylus longicornis TaxID=2530218 RepID=UPI00244D9C2A|nr:uncharacterized protein LOC129607046 [Condylostylus longicornis]
MIKTKYVILLFLSLILNFKIQNLHGHRAGKTLIFPPTSPTRVQFIYGIGIPLEDLDVESLTTGYVLKAEYFLPTKAEEFRPTQLTPQDIGYYPNSKRDLSKYNDAKDKENIDPIGLFNIKQSRRKAKLLSKYRWAVYESFEVLLKRAGYDGEACLLRSICEIAAVPFHPNSGLMAELIHILMSPSTSCDVLGKHKQNQFYKAEILGKQGEPCEIIFKECQASVLEKFTFIRDLFNMFG